MTKRALPYTAIAAIAFAVTQARAQSQPTDAPKPPDAPAPPTAAPAPPPSPPKTVPLPPPATVSVESSGVTPDIPSPRRRRGMPRGVVRAERRPMWGGLGYASIGFLMGTFSGLEETLGEPDALGVGYAPASAGLALGGGGGGLLGGRVWIGGKGFGLGVETPPGKTGEAELSGGGGGFELGYAALAREDLLIIPYIGAGGFGYGLEVRNLGATPYPVFEGEEVPAGGSREYIAGFWTAELGVRVFRLLMWRNEDRAGMGGFAIGGEVGYIAALGRGLWNRDTEKNVGQPSADLSALYVRLTLGGGGFTLSR